MRRLFTRSERLHYLGIGVLLVVWAVIVANSTGIEPPRFASVLAWFTKGVAGCYIAHGLGVDTVLQRWTALARLTAYLHSSLFQWQVTALFVLTAGASYLVLITVSAHAPNQARSALFTTVVYSTALAMMHVVTAIRLWRKCASAGQAQSMQTSVTPAALVDMQDTRQKMWKAFLLWAVVFLVCLAVGYFRGAP